MLQSGLTRLKSVFVNSGNGDQCQEKERHHPKAGRSVSVGLRPELSRQILVKKMSVPSLPASTSSPSHSRVQLSRSVPSYHQQHSPSCSTSYNKHIHRKLSRTAAPMSSAGDLAKIKHRRERARSASTLIREEHPHGGKRAKQDLNRNFHHKSKTESDSSSDPEDHIYEEIDSDYFGENDVEEMETDNFLLGISLERQRNLKFYGSAGWDFGSVT